MKAECIFQLLSLVAKYDGCDTIFWNEALDFSVICNDAFWWGTADLEHITDENVSVLETAFKDGGEIWGPLLFCARMRKMRPQQAMYKHIDASLHPLFDACGPERKLDMGNPG